MPVRVFVTLPPADGPAVTGGRAGAAGDAGVHGNASRRVVGGAALLRVLRAPAADDCGALPTRVQSSFIGGALARQVAFLCGGNCGTALLLYTLRDYAETRDLEVHVAFSELRCCVKDEDARAVRQADGRVGALLAGASSPEGRLASLV
ncbi:hypothetical protein TcBrA4_0006200 [Trypanosoma cruzi]|nr:hypothetical protein TcBrA4_0006200 [Trypanosoma cruzi]